MKKKFSCVKDPSPLQSSFPCLYIFVIYISPLAFIFVNEILRVDPDCDVNQ